MTLSIFTFDFWNTLAFPNPTFSTIRNNIFADRFRVSEVEASNRYTNFKTESEKYTEKNGTAYYGLRQAISFYEKNLDEGADKEYIMESAIQDYALINKAFIMYPPRIELEPLILPACKSFISTGIVSNTNFISGATILQAMPDEFFDYVDFTLFSDLVGFSKPNKYIFDYAKRNAEALYHAEINKNNYHHFGDNKFTDVIGPQSAGYKGYLIKQSDIFDTVKKVMENL